MKIVFRNLFFCITLCCIICPIFSAYGQGLDRPGASRSTPPIRAMAVGLEGDLRVLEILDANLDSIGRLRLGIRSYSSQFTCPIVDGKIVFGIKGGFDEEGKQLYKPIASTVWKPEYKKICLVFIPKSFTGNQDMDVPYLVRVMDMGDKNYELGTTKVINFSPVTAYVQFGEHKEILERGKTALIPKIEKIRGANMAQLNVYFLRDDKPQTVMQTRMRYLERIRYLIVVYPDFVNKRLGVSTINDYGNLF